MANKIHEGRNIKCFREMLNLKQDALAARLGDDWNQKKVSMLESKQEIDAELVEQVAKALQIPAQFITDFDGDASTININNVHDVTVPGEATSLNVGGSDYNHNNTECTFNAFDKVVELFERQLAEQKALLERLLASEQEKMQLMRELLERK